jgi:hypothetical protein
MLEKDVPGRIEDALPPPLGLLIPPLARAHGFSKCNSSNELYSLYGMDRACQHLYPQASALGQYNRILR